MALVVNWLAAAAVICFFYGCCRLILPGAQRASYRTAVLLFGSAPVLAGCTFAPSADVPALGLLLGSWYLLLRYETRSVLLLTAGALAALLMWLYLLAPELPLAAWSPRHFLSAQFATPTSVREYTVPNLLFGLSPVCHWGFAVLLPLFLTLFKKTDLQLTEKKVLAGAIGAHLLLLGGLPLQDLRHLLPVWALGLLLLFPAIDRAISYGFFYAKNVVVAVLVVGVLVQMVGMVCLFKQVFQFL
jgi:hypothetical protein